MTKLPRIRKQRPRKQNRLKDLLNEKDIAHLMTINEEMQREKEVFVAGFSPRWNLSEYTKEPAEVVYKGIGPNGVLLFECVSLKHE